MEGEKRDLFSVVSSGGVVCDDEVVEVVEEGGVGNERRKRQRPDSRKGIGKGEFKSGYLAPPVEPPSSSGVENEFPNTVGNRISLVAAQAQAKTGLVINRKQVGNPMLRYFRNVVYHFSDSIAPDLYVVDTHTRINTREACTHFLSYCVDVTTTSSPAATAANLTPFSNARPRFSHAYLLSVC